MTYRTLAGAFVAVLLILSACSADAEITSEVTNGQAANDQASDTADPAATNTETESTSSDPDAADDAVESVEPQSPSPAPATSALDDSAPDDSALAEDAPAESVETAASTASNSRFLATIGGAVYETDTLECFWLSDTAVAISGEGSGPSGPFQFFMQAGQDEELSFQAGEFVVFVLPAESDLSFTVEADVVSASVTLAVDKILEIAGTCDGAEIAAP